MNIDEFKSNIAFFEELHGVPASRVHLDRNQIHGLLVSIGQKVPVPRFGLLGKIHGIEIYVCETEGPHISGQNGVAA